MTRARLACVAMLALGLVLSPFAHAQTRLPTVGVLGMTPFDKVIREPFMQALTAVGYVEEKTMVIELRDAGGRPDRLAGLAADLVAKNVDVILTRGAGPLEAAQRATSRIPIIAVDLESDPVVRGFVRTLAQPSGNISGVFLDLPELSGKQLQLLKEAMPSITRVAILGDPALNAPQFNATEAAAERLGLQSHRVEVRTPQEFDAALEAAGKARASAVLLLSSPLVFTGREAITALALKRRLPAISMFVEFADAGGLMTYGPSLREAFQRAGRYAGRVLKGTKPGDMPVERPDKFDLVINLRTADTLGVRIPPALLSRADRTIR